MRSCSLASPACAVWAGNTVQTAVSSSTDNRTVSSPFQALAWRFPGLSMSGSQLRVVPTLNCRAALSSYAPKKVEQIKLFRGADEPVAHLR